MQMGREPLVPFPAIMLLLLLKSRLEQIVRISRARSIDSDLLSARFPGSLYLGARQAELLRRRTDRPVGEIADSYHYPLSQ